MTTTAVPGCPVDESFDPLSPEFLADPYAVMAALPQPEAPIFFAPSIGYYVLTRYADIETVFRDPATYSAAVAQAPLVPIVPEAKQILLAGGHKPQPSMVSLDEREHARLRKPAAHAFSMKRVTAMIPTIEATTAGLLDGVGTKTEFDLVAALAFPLPANIVFSLMGVPQEDYAQLKQWCGYRAALSWGRPAPQDQVEITTNMAAYRKYLRDLVDAKVLEPGDDVTSDLIAIHHEDPERLTLDEIAPPAAGAGPATHLPPQHLFPGTSDLEGAGTVTVGRRPAPNGLSRRRRAAWRRRTGHRTPGPRRRLNPWKPKCR
jgi:cytochrome P450